MEIYLKSLTIKISKILLFLFVGLGLTNCSNTLSGASSALGLVAFEERSIETYSKDLVLHTKLHLNFLKTKKNDLILGVGIEVFESRVLLTGSLPSDKLITEAVSLAWQVKGVLDVINEIKVKKIAARDFTNDTWISAQINSKITFDRDIYAINYKIDVANGVIYLIGLAQNDKELARVISHAQNIQGVKRVKNYVRIKKES